MSNVLKSIVSIKIVAIFNHISYHSSLFQESVYSIFVHLPHGFFKNQRPRQSKPKNVLRTELLKKIEQKAPKKHKSIKALFVEYLKEKHPAASIPRRLRTECR